MAKDTKDLKADRNVEDLPVSRRTFVQTTAGIGATGLLGAALNGCASTEISHTAGQVPGGSILSTDERFEERKDDLVWQVIKPARSPDIIIDAKSSADVISAVNYARNNKLKIIAKSGGHSMTGSFVRDEGVLLNLLPMRQVSVDPVSKIVSVEPGTWGPSLLQKLSEYGLGFPVARGASVAVGGYLLGGGLGFNPNTWGIGCDSILAADVVNAEGELITVSAKNYPELYWAVRGAGPGLCGIVTKFYIQAYDLPGSIMTAQYVHPLAEHAKVGAALEALVPSSDHLLELILLITGNPDKQAVADGASEYVCMVNVVAYGETAEHSQRLLKTIADSPLAESPLTKTEYQATNLAILTGDTGAAFPRGRMATEGVWSNSIAPVVSVLAERVELAATPITTVSIRFLGNAVMPKNAAFSIIGSTNRLSVLTWENENDDDTIKQWLADTMTALKPFSLGHYINNEDVVNFPQRNQGSFSAHSWTKLRALKQKYDTNGVFHDYYGVG